MNSKTLDLTHPLSCCTRFLNGMCLEMDSYQVGCFEAINKYIHTYSRYVVGGGIGIALCEVWVLFYELKILFFIFHFQLTALILAVCVCRYSIKGDEFDWNIFDRYWVIIPFFVESVANLLFSLKSFEFDQHKSVSPLTRYFVAND